MCDFCDIWIENCSMESLKCFFVENLIFFFYNRLKVTLYSKMND